MQTTLLEFRFVDGCLDEQENGGGTLSTDRCWISSRYSLGGYKKDEYIQNMLSS